MSLRLLQILLALGNCCYGAFLMLQYGPVFRQSYAWPLSLDQDVILLIGMSVLPIALLSLRFPIVAGILEFACAFIGLQLLHSDPLPHLTHYANVTMIMAAAVLAVAVLRGVTEVTYEAFHQKDEKPRKRSNVSELPAQPASSGSHARAPRQVHTIPPRNSPSQLQQKAHAGTRIRKSGDGSLE